MSNKNMTYTLRFPFKLISGREIFGLDTRVERTFDKLRLSLERVSESWVLTITGFDSEESANEYMDRLKAGFVWLMLDRFVGIDASFEPQSLEYCDDPIQAAANLSKAFNTKIEPPVDCLIDGNRPAIFRSNKQVRHLVALSPEVITSIGSDDFFELLNNGASLTSDFARSGDSKLETALELFGAHLREPGGRTRVLTLVTALEVLTEDQYRPTFIRELLDQWIKQIKEIKQSLPPACEKVTEYDRLQNELSDKRQDSLTSRLRRLVSETLGSGETPQEASYADRAVKLYGKRGRLTHTGRLASADLSEAESDAKEITKAVLKIHFRTARKT
jgi:hypothetical protein